MHHKSIALSTKTLTRLYNNNNNIIKKRLFIATCQLSIKLSRALPFNMIIFCFNIFLGFNCYYFHLLSKEHISHRLPLSLQSWRSTVNKGFDTFELRSFVCFGVTIFQITFSILLFLHRYLFIILNFTYYLPRVCSF